MPPTTTATQEHNNNNNNNKKKKKIHIENKITCNINYKIWGPG
jgi:hypothetical protein